MRMAEVKFSQIANFLCENPPHSRYYRTTRNKQTLLVRKAPMQDIKEAYRAVFAKILAQGEVEEAVLKKQIFTAEMPEGVPSISQVLKELKITLREFIEVELGFKSGQMAAECSPESVA